MARVMFPNLKDKDIHYVEGVIDSLFAIDEFDGKAVVQVTMTDLTYKFLMQYVKLDDNGCLRGAKVKIDSNLRQGEIRSRSYKKSNLVARIK